MSPRGAPPQTAAADGHQVFAALRGLLLAQPGRWVLVHDIAGHVYVNCAPADARGKPQFFGAVRDEVTRVQHPERLEKRTRDIARMGLWATPRVVAAAERRGARIAETVKSRIFGLVDVLLTPTIPGRPPEVGVVEGRGAVPSLLASTTMIGYCAIWNVTGHPAAAVPAGIAADGLPTSVLDAHGRSQVARLIDEGLIVRQAERLVLTQRGRLLADGVVRDLLD